MSFSLDLYSDNGSLPPPHRRSTRIVLHADGTGTIRRRRGYSENTETEHAFRLVAPEALAESLRESGLWRTGWRSPEIHPVGGPSTRLTATLDGVSATIPTWVVREQAKLKSALVSMVRDAIPGSE